LGAPLSPGPDGQLWTFLDNQLVEIRPDTGQITFVSKDIYLTGKISLRRIRLPTETYRTSR
jgi:hypothetical protein